MIRQQLLLLPSSLDKAYVPPFSHSTRPQRDNGSVQGPGSFQGSQGLLQTLLDLGETFLASELSEVDLQDLETKLYAAKNREHDAIRDLQKKIEELSGMSAMVTRLKNELKEEKEKAKEEAEDLTQEMAELRYQLMQRMDEERELRALSEEASLRRIAELEAQLKYAKQEMSHLLAWKQSAEVQGRACNLEMQNLKCALEEAKQTQKKLIQNRDEAERNMADERNRLQAEAAGLQTELTSTFAKFRAANAKAEELEKKCRSLREESETALQLVDQKRALVQLTAIEEGIAHRERVQRLSAEETFEDLQTSEQQNFQLLQEVTDVLELVTSFKLQLVVLASEYHEVEGRLHFRCGGGDSLHRNSHCTLPLDGSDADHDPDIIRDVACVTDVEESSAQAEDHKTVQVTGSELLMISDFVQSTNAMEVAMKGLLYEVDIGRDAQLGSENAHVADIKEISRQEVSSFCETDMEPAVSIVCADKSVRPQDGLWTDESVRTQDGLWSVAIIVDLVDSVTEEMTKFLRILLRSQDQKPEVLHSLESRLQLWSNIPQKSLPGKVIGSGVLSEWGALVVDLLVQSQRGMNSMLQTIRDQEMDKESLRNVRDEVAALSAEAMYAKEELINSNAWFESELFSKEGTIQILERKLEQSNRALLEAQTSIGQQEISHAIIVEQLHKYEAEMKELEALLISEKKGSEESLANLHEALQRERTRANRDVDRFERTLEELRSRLAENEQELEALVHANELNIGAVVAAKLRQLDQKLKNSQLAEIELQAECSKLTFQVEQLQAKVEEAERELETEKERHVEALIQYEEEQNLREAELQVCKQGLRLKNTSLVPTGKIKPTERITESWFGLRDSHEGVEFQSEGEQAEVENLMQILKQTILEKDQLLTAQTGDLSFQKELNRKLINECAHLEAELLSVRQEILLYESQAADMESTFASLQEALLLERVKADQAQTDMDMHTKRQDEDYLNFKSRLDELLSNIKLMQSELTNSRRGESEAWGQVKNLNSELLKTKEQTLRLQKSLKQLEGQLDLERVKQREAQVRFLQQAEEMKCLEGEKLELRRLLVQSEGECLHLEREKDELESKLSRRRGAFSR